MKRKFILNFPHQDFLIPSPVSANLGRRLVPYTWDARRIKISHRDLYIYIYIYIYPLVVSRDLAVVRCTDYTINVVWFMEPNHGSHWNITGQWRCLICIDHETRHLTQFIFFNAQKIPQGSLVNLLECICFMYLLNKTKKLYFSVLCSVINA